MPAVEEETSKQEPLVATIAMSAGAAVIAETMTLPFDTAKVRLQLQNIAGSKTGLDLHKYRGSLQTIQTIIREEGAAAPFKGLVPGIHRQFLFTGLRLGLYEKVRDSFAGGAEEAPVYARIGAALVTSAIGITVANPSDVVKVRQQACSIRADVRSEEPASKPRYRSATDAYRRILAEEGLRGGLYRGYLPNLIRNSVISATELVAYDTTKHALLHWGMPDNIGLHIVSALSAGFAATTLGSPWDVIGTRLMAQSNARGADKEALGTFVMNMIRNEGFMSLYKGYTHNFARIGSFNLVLWLSYEQLRHVFSNHSL